MPSAHPTPAVHPSGPRSSAQRLRARLLHRGLTVEARIAYALAVAAVTLTVLVSLFPADVPFTSLLVPLVLASVFLGPRTLPWFVGLLLVLLAVSLTQQDELTSRTLGAAAVQFVIALVVLLGSRRRTRLGVAGQRGETMFVDLRDRILHQGGGIADLPEEWWAESALHSAGGTAFSGDFVVASRSSDGRMLEVAVVDVSGKGEEAGTRALLLSGAFGALLGALPPDGFLPAANDYLLRQDWGEGFATAIHLSLDLATGSFEVRAAGHPPAAHRHAGSGRWSVLPGDGPVLGLVPDAEFACAAGRIARGDAVLLYTDGMVEEPRRDIDLGIDRMLGEAESVVRDGYVGSAERLARALGSRDDDRAMMVVHRR